MKPFYVYTYMTINYDISFINQQNTLYIISWYYSYISTHMVYHIISFLFTKHIHWWEGHHHNVDICNHIHIHWEITRGTAGCALTGVQRQSS